jgi:hypothetical protein
VPAAQAQPGDLELAHDSGDALVVDQLAGLAQFGSDARAPYVPCDSRCAARIFSASAWSAASRAARSGALASQW